MACSSCSKRRRKPGSTIASAILLGDENGLVYRVKVLDNSILPTYTSGRTAYVTGSLVDEAVNDGLLEALATYNRTPNTSAPRQYCVNTECFAALRDARAYAASVGGTIQIQTS